MNEPINYQFDCICAAADLKHIPVLNEIKEALRLGDYGQAKSKLLEIYQGSGTVFDDRVDALIDCL